MFTSNTTNYLFEAPSTFYAKEFHFHCGSEHTISGKRFDLEMNVVHYPKLEKGGIKAASVRVLFDVHDYHVDGYTWTQRRIIRAFFDSLKWQNTGKVRLQEPTSTDNKAGHGPRFAIDVK